MQVSIVKLTDDSLVIGQLSSDSDNYILENPYRLEISSFDGTVLVPFLQAAFVEPRIKLFKSSIVFMTTPKDFISKKYIALIEGGDSSNV